MWRYRIIKFTRAIRIFFGGFSEMEEKHKLFQLSKPLGIKEIAEKVQTYSYYYNTLSTTYKKQIYTVRKLVDLDHQYHLRFYSDGWVSGHYELRPDSHPLEHLDGVELRSLTSEERQQIQKIFVTG